MKTYNSRRLMFDTNVLLDALNSLRSQSKEALEVLRLCNTGEAMGMVSPGSLKDIYSILTKQFDEVHARKAVRALMGLLVILPLEAKACIGAIRSSEPDFEDGLVRAAAELSDVDFILTRDAAAFRTSTIRSVTCAEYLEIHALEQRRVV